LYRISARYLCSVVYVPRALGEEYAGVGRLQMPDLFFFLRSSSSRTVPSSGLSECVGPFPFPPLFCQEQVEKSPPRGQSPFRERSSFSALSGLGSPTLQGILKNRFSKGLFFFPPLGPLFSLSISRPPGLGGSSLETFLFKRPPALSLDKEREVIRRKEPQRSSSPS